MQLRVSMKHIGLAIFAALAAGTLFFAAASPSSTPPAQVAGARP